MTDMPIVQIFGFFRGNELIATSNAIYSEQGTRIEHLRHRLSPLLPFTLPSSKPPNAKERSFCDHERCEDSRWRELCVRAVKWERGSVICGT